ncbi:MAG: cysteine--tRNA ligase [Anaerolineae bacterium]|jgi:cysteinyl-tRNA synthetase|nr:cysteine--tRNA ligase [Anaerolineae bacterium]
MSLVVYNTLTREKETFETLEPGKVRMYVCGPTVYDEAHVGHAMSSIVFDFIRRYLAYKGYEVRHVMNFTDVDDKIISRANKTGEDPAVIASRYTEKYKAQLEQLNVLRPAVFPRVSQTIPEIIQMVAGLLEEDHAYVTPSGDVYFRVRSDPDYGKLSRRRLDDAVSGTRVTGSEEKKDEGDFALWKTAKPGEPSWDSPWGKGRPGWHIECSAMNLLHLGDQIDIHGGGNDLVFPHHENEIAQTESFTGKSFARYWLHNGMLQLKGEKMSKSLGNLVTIDDFLAQHGPDVLRLVIAGSGYRKPLAFNDDVVADGERALERLRGALRPATGSTTSGPVIDALAAQAAQARTDFEAAMDDDFNTAGGLAALFDFVRAINTARDAGVGGQPFGDAQAIFNALIGVLGLNLATPEAGGQSIAPFVELLLTIRQDLRKAKQWALSDKIRDELKALGVVVEDSAQGSSWRLG